MIEKDENSIADLIEQNLFAVYQSIGKELSFQNLHSDGSCFTVFENKNSWPYINFGRPTPEKISILKNNTTAPRSWIVNQNKESETLFEKEGFKKVMTWPGLALKVEDGVSEISEEFVEVKDGNLEDWLEVLNNVLFVRQALSLDYIQKLYNSNLAIHFYGYRVGVKISCVAMTVQRGGYLNIFMVAALPAVRGKGIGGSMMKNIIRKAKESGCEYLFLQSTLKAEKLYNRLGFKRYCYFDIYHYFDRQ